MREVSLTVRTLTGRDPQPFYLPANLLPKASFPSLARLSDEKQEQAVAEVFFGVCFFAVHASSYDNSRIKQPATAAAD
jgi:hypothetical protein